MLEQAKIIIILILALGLSIMWGHNRSLAHIIEKKNTDIQALTKSVDICTDANKSNLTVITSLRKDKLKSDSLLTKMAAEKIKREAFISDFLTRIQSSPDVSPASPLLRETISQIILHRTSK